MSKTLGNVLDPRDFINDYGADPLRYYLARTSPLEDGDITADLFRDVYNADLANGLGNLTARVLNMAVAYEIDWSAVAMPTMTEVLATEKDFASACERLRFDEAVRIIQSKIAASDASIQETEPFKKVKIDRDAAREDVRKLTENLWIIATLLEPIMPTTSATIKEAITARKKPENLFSRREG